MEEMDNACSDEGSPFVCSVNVHREVIICSESRAPLQQVIFSDEDELQAVKKNAIRNVKIDKTMHFARLILWVNNGFSFARIR